MAQAQKALSSIVGDARATPFDTESQKGCVLLYFCFEKNCNDITTDTARGLPE